MADGPDHTPKNAIGIYDRPPFWRRPQAWVAAAAVAVAAGVTAIVLLV